MNEYNAGEHPIEQNLKRIKKEGIVVLDKVKGLPSSEGPFVSPDYVICIGHQGYNRLMYNDMYDFSEAQTVAVIFPNQSLLEISKSDDYLATLIVADSSMLNEPMLQIINQMRYRYEPNPRVKLDNHQYKMIMNVVELMLETSNLKLAERRMLHLRQLEFLLRLLGYYRQNNLNELPKDTPVSNRFLDLLKKNFRQHRDVAFYAEKVCLTPKYFGEVIKEETGYTATHWISTQVIVEAKMLLHTRHDLSVQAIADMLGFDEQATFSRYFKRETGMSPKDFREKKD